MEVAGPLGTPLGLSQRKRASPRGEAGTSGFLSVSDSDRRVPAELGQESQASSCLRKGTPLASRVARGSHAPRRAVCGTRGALRTMHGGGSAPSCPWTLAHQVQLSMILQARILKWIAFHSPGDLPDPGIKSMSLGIAGRFLTISATSVYSSLYLFT